MDSTLCNPIERFIRNVLGCQCPDAVFRRIGVEDCPGEFGNWPGGRLISAGDRLLILVLHSDDSDLMHRMLGGLLREGRRLRESRGFNRFRLVIATTCAGLMEPSLMKDFERLEGMDERLHLHVIAAERLPALPCPVAIS
jgi:hypothetical protein